MLKVRTFEHLEHLIARGRLETFPTLKRLLLTGKSREKCHGRPLGFPAEDEVTL